MLSTTRKLPKGHSYPLKPKALEAALIRADLTIELNLIREPGDLFRAHFWPPNANVPYERLYVQAGTVPKENASEARHRMENVIIPRLVEWLANILAQDLKSTTRRERQSIDLNPLKV